MWTFFSRRLRRWVLFAIAWPVAPVSSSAASLALLTLASLAGMLVGPRTKPATPTRTFSAPGR
jgi:hypothetical protein